MASPNRLLPQPYPTSLFLNILQEKQYSPKWRHDWQQRRALLERIIATPKYRIVDNHIALRHIIPIQLHF